MHIQNCIYFVHIWLSACLHANMLVSYSLEVMQYFEALLRSCSITFRLDLDQVDWQSTVGATKRCFHRISGINRRILLYRLRWKVTLDTATPFFHVSPFSLLGISNPAWKEKTMMKYFEHQGMTCDQLQMLSVLLWVFSWISSTRAQQIHWVYDNNEMWAREKQTNCSCHSTNIIMVSLSREA